MSKFELVSQEEYNKYSCSHTAIPYEELKLPRVATKGSAGHDFFSPISFMLPAGHSIKIPTFIKCKLAPMRVLLILPRSSHGFKYRVQLDNTCGVVDSDYYGNPDNEGHIYIKITNDSKEDKTLTVNAGDAIAQGLIVMYEIAEGSESETFRVSGIGSTSKK